MNEYIMSFIINFATSMQRVIHHEWCLLYNLYAFRKNQSQKIMRVLILYIKCTIFIEKVLQ